VLVRSKLVLGSKLALVLVLALVCSKLVLALGSILELELVHSKLVLVRSTLVLVRSNRSLLCGIRTSPLRWLVRR
jgi:hypothetical protein